MESVERFRCSKENKTNRKIGDYELLEKLKVARESIFIGLVLDKAYVDIIMKTLNVYLTKIVV